MNERLMDSCLEAEGLSFDDGQMKKLSTYDELLRQYNPSLKMVKAEGDEFIVRHYADSLVAVSTLRPLSRMYEKPTIADLGSGAGLPGIPLAIAMPEVRFSLVERMEKRASFLRTVVGRLHLGNVEIVCQRLQEVEKKYEIVTCRAFHPFYDIEDEVDAVLRDDGIVVLYKGREEVIQDELAQVRGDWTFRTLPVKVPFLEAERALCIGKRGKA